MRLRLCIRYWPTPALLPALLPASDGEVEANDLHTVEKPVVEWVIFAGERLKDGPGRCYLDQLADHMPDDFVAEKVETILMIPSEFVSLLVVTPPSKQSKHLQRAVGFMLEEQLVDDPENLHFAIGGKRSIKVMGGQIQKVPVAVIDKILIEQVLANLREVSLVPAVAIPDCFSLPEPLEHGEEQRWVIVVECGRVVVRSGHVSGQAMNPTQMRPLLAALYRRMIARCNAEAGVDRIELTLEFIYQRTQDDDNPEAISMIESISGIVSNLIVAAESDEVKLPVKLRVRRVTSKLPAMVVTSQSYLSSTPPDFNLLQGMYKQHAEKSNRLGRWGQAASIAAVWVLLQLGMHASEAVWHSAEAQRLDDLSKTLFREINPEAQRIQSVKIQLSALLTGGENSNENLFLPLIKKTGDPIASINTQRANNQQITLNRLSFDNEQAQLKLDLYVSGYPVLDRLKLALENNGLKVDIEGASSDADRVKVKMKVKV